MACKTETREFVSASGENVVIFVRQLPATKALDLQIELLNVMGTDVFPFIEDEYDFANILRVMIKTSHDKLSTLIKDIVCLANKNGKEIKASLFDLEYNGDLMLICRVFAFVCEVNFKDFFSQGLEMNAQKQLAVTEIAGQVN